MLQTQSTDSTAHTVAVLGLRYWDDQPTEGDLSALDAYQAARAYQVSGIEVSYHEPDYRLALQSTHAVERIGQLCGEIASDVADALRDMNRVLLTGASCSHAPGILGGIQQAWGIATRVGLIWLDAHGDFNTPKTTLSGGLYGMPLAVCAGLGVAQWREMSGILAPLATDRIILVDARNLDPPEAALIHSTSLVVARANPQRQGVDFATALSDLAARSDVLYLHIDTDILDPAFMPTAHIMEPNGPSLDDILALIAQCMATGKVDIVAIASVRNLPDGGDVSVASGVAMIQVVLAAWLYERTPR